MAEMLRGLLDKPEQMRRVGLQAQQGLYLSWEDSVANAWEGYGTVIEKYRSGGNAPEKTASDEAFRNLGDLMDKMSRLDRLDLRKTVEIRGKSLSLAEVSGLIHKILDQGEESLRQRYDRFL